jgi:tetratricopeptide (TPR) repeat protein
LADSKAARLDGTGHPIMLESLRSMQPLEVGIVAVLGVYFAIWIHEGGHALAGRIAGFRITSMGTGFGRPLLRLPWRGTVFYLGLRRPFQGITTSVRDEWPTRKSAKAILLMGGFAANAGVTLVAWGGYSLITPQHPWLLLFAFVNGAFALFALLPANIALPGVALKTDASQVIGLFLRSRKPRENLTRIHDAERFVTFLSLVRDRFGEFHYRIHLASTLSDIGSYNRALEVLEEVQEDCYPERSPMGALLRVVRGTAHLFAGDPQKAQEDLERSASYFREIDAPSMAPHLTLLQARKALLEDRMDDATALLDDLEASEASPEEVLFRAEVDLKRGEPEAALRRMEGLPSLRGEDRLLQEGILGEAGRQMGRDDLVDNHLSRAARRLLRNLPALSDPEDREAYLEKHKRITEGYLQHLQARKDEEGARDFENTLRGALEAPTAPAILVSLTGLTSLGCSLASVGFLTWEFVKVAEFQGSIRGLIWGGVLALAGLYFGVSGLLNRRSHRALPILGGILGAFCLVVLVTFFGTLMITRRGVYRETLEYDTNGDGKPDRVVVFQKGVRLREETDTDFDGKIDRWIDFRNGEAWRVRGDGDGDGEPDWEEVKPGWK